jgi:Ca-activated chloride channel family protein
MPLLNKHKTLSFLVLVAGVALSAAQTAQTAPPTSVMPGVQKPAAAEAQPPLDVDRDPVLSPDADDNLGVSPKTPTPSSESSAPKSPVKPNTVTRGANGTFTIRQNVEEVVLNATVLDNNNHLVTTLDQNAFKVFEDNVPQTIASFRREDLPVSLGILVDNSGSMTTKRKSVAQASLDMVRSSNPQDEVFLVSFNEEATLEQPFSSNLNRLQESFNAITPPKGGTAIYDAVIASGTELAKAAKRPKQVLVIITDGEDNASTETLEDTIREVQDLQGPIVYCIGLLYEDQGGGGREARRAKRALEALASQTGGVAYFPKSLAEVDGVAAEVARDIRSQYTIGYHSTKPASEGGYRTVRVVAKASSGGKLTVRTRSGYYPRSDARSVKASK